MRIYCFFLILFLLTLAPGSSDAQTPDHWETVVYNYDVWRYRPAFSEPPANWMAPGFNDTNWVEGGGGIGYGDNDDQTVINPVISLYMRREFELVDTAAILFAVFHADYDDAYVAYLNGVEFARGNIGSPGIPPAYDQTADDFHEAQLYRGEIPEAVHLSGPSMKSLIRPGENTLAIQVHNHSFNSSDLSSNFFFSVALSDNSTNYRETPDWFNPPLINSSLPLILIDTDGAAGIPDEPRVGARMGIIDNGPGQGNSIFDPANDYDGRIAIEIRGASSQSFPKKNYGFETQDQNGDNNNVSLLGMPEENDWVLHGPYSDKSLMRNVLAYHLAAQTGRYAPRTRWCELLINGEYRGVYVLTERIKRDRNRVDIANLRPEDLDGDELTGGYILQIDRDDPSTDLDGWYSNYPTYKFFAFDDPDYDQIMPAQRDYIRNFIETFEQTMNGAAFFFLYDEYVNVSSWVDYFLITEIGKHIDAYKLSFFMYKRKDSNGGKLHFGPIWDLNLAFGNFDFVCSPDPEGWSYEFQGTCDFSHPFWVRSLTEIPQVSHQTNCRWQELRSGPLHTDSLLQFIDRQVERLQAPGIRNFERWPVLGTYVWPNSFVGQTYEEEVNFLKNWLVQRLDWMDEHMIGDCGLYVSSREQQAYSAVSVHPNPVDDLLYLEYTGRETAELVMRIYDLQGRLLKETEIRERLSEIPVADLASGMYFYTLTGEHQIIHSGKLVIE